MIFENRFGPSAELTEALLFEHPDFDWLSATLSPSARSTLNKTLRTIPTTVNEKEAEILFCYVQDRNLLTREPLTRHDRQRLKDIDTCENHARATFRAGAGEYARRLELSAWLKTWTEDNI